MDNDALFTVSSPSRHAATQDGYDVRKHRYRPEYVHPNSWRLELMAWPRGSAEINEGERKAPSDLLELQWDIKEKDGPFSTTVKFKKPNVSLRLALDVPRATHYKITLSLKFQEGHNITVSRNYELRDLLIVSIGDSFASGEGNPDVQKVATNSEQAFCKATTVAILRDRIDALIDSYVAKVINEAQEAVDEVPLVGLALVGIISGTANVVGHIRSAVTGVAGAAVGVVDAIGEGIEEFAGWFGGGGGGENPRPAAWQEPSAHRSYNSAHSLAARQIEVQDSFGATRVTFLSFARSGADLRHGILDERVLNAESHRPYALDAWIGNRGQVQEAKEAVNGRPIDALIMTAGINDLEFSSQVSNAILWKSGEKRTQRISEATKVVKDDLPTHFTRLRKAIKTQLNPGMVFVTEYPVGVFDELKEGNPCGILGSKVGFNLDKNEAKAMGALGRQLNAQLRKLTDESEWKFVSGIEEGFLNHGYCGGDSFFIGAEESCLIQGDFDGTLHPNKKGHAVARDCIYAALSEHFLRPSSVIESVLQIMMSSPDDAVH